MASWLGLNRATLAVLIVIGCLGLSEEIWSNFLSLYFKDLTGVVYKAAAFIGVIAAAKNLLEGFGYIIGGTVAHRMGPRVALAVSRCRWRSASPSCWPRAIRGRSRSARC